MSPSKTEFIKFGGWHQLQKSTVTSIQAVKDSIPETNSIKLLGVWLDNVLTSINMLNSNAYLPSQTFID